MAIQRVGFILDQHGDGPNARIQAVAEGKVDDPVFAPERNSRLGAVLRERREPFAFAARENHGEHILHGRDSIRTNPK